MIEPIRDQWLIILALLVVAGIVAWILRGRR
jgi:hypothetical protein